MLWDREIKGKESTADNVVKPLHPAVIRVLHLLCSGRIKVDQQPKKTFGLNCCSVFDVLCPREIPFIHTEDVVKRGEIFRSELTRPVQRLWQVSFTEDLRADANSSGVRGLRQLATTRMR